MLAETEKKVAAAASGNKQRATREDLLQAINAIAQSLDKTAQSINNSIGDSKQVASDVHAMKTDIVNQLSERTDSIEDKLTKIAEAINAQTALKKKQTDDAEGTVKESNLEKQAKVVTTNIPVDTTDDTFDLKDAASNIKLDYDPESDNESPSDDVKEGPQAERGAILSGPDSGYKVPGLTLHGDEAIVPLDNNYTQGEPSAVDGKVRPTPSEPMVPPMNVNVNNSYEMGKSFSNVNNSYEEGTPMGKSSPIEIPNLMADSSLEQPLVDAMALPTKVAGGMALAASSELVKRLSGDSPEVASEMAKVITPLASVFDLPKSLVGKAKAGESLKKEPSILTGGDEEKKEKKNVFQKVFDGLKNLFNPDNDPAPPKDTHNPSTTGSGEAGEMISTGAKTTYYDPSLGGINASGHKTAEGLPATSTGEGYKEDVFSAAAFPPLLATLPKNMTVPAARFPGGRTLKKPFNVVVTNTKTGKSAVVRVNDVGPGVEGHSSNHMLDLSVAAKNYLGTGEGYSIAYAKPGSKPGPLVEPKPEPKTTGDTSDLEAQSKSSQGITETFGARTGERIYFEHDGKQYNAFKLGGGGFDLYRGSMKIDTTGGKNAAILKSFIEYGQERVKPPATKPPATKVDPTQAMRGSTAAEKAQVAMINMGGEQTQSAATGAVPTSQGTTVAPSVSSLSKSVFTVDGVTT
jgi:hypothetical protein